MSSSDYTDEDSPRWPQVPQAHTDWVKADQSGGCWLRLVLRSPISCAARQKWQWLNQSVLAILGSFSTLTSTMQHYMANTKHSGMRERKMKAHHQSNLVIEKHFQTQVSLKGGC